ncbi:MAG: hypothetical protein WC140_00980 [Bacteroidales bacterium]
MNYEANISNAEVESLNLSAFEGPIGVITEKDAEYAEAIEYLYQQTVIGFDTETRPVFKACAKRNEVALLQLSGGDKAFVFRLNKLGLPSALVNILADPKIIKVGAAVRDDIKGLQRYTKFVDRGFVDLQSVVSSYGINEKSVKKLGGIILGIRISKAKQLSNWEAPILSGAQLKYAATDAWICRKMYIELNNNMSAKEVKYKDIIPQLESLISPEELLVTNLSNICAVLKSEFNFWWVGFYFNSKYQDGNFGKKRKLLLGPYQGPLACSRIPFKLGVCGTAWLKKKTIIVEDVDKFPTHLACSSLSRSEIVVPIFINKKQSNKIINENKDINSEAAINNYNIKDVYAVLDIDSEKLAEFDETDKKYLEILASAIGEIIK